MEENLNFGQLINSYQTPSNNGVVEKYYFNDENSNGNSFGALYTREEIVNYEDLNMFSFMDMKGICPSGWRLPNNEDFLSLFNYLGGFEIAGYKLKSSSGWSNKADGSSGNGNNSGGLNILPSGYYSRGSNPEFKRIGEMADIFFLYGDYRETTQNYLSFYYEYDYVRGYISNSSLRTYSVRCIKE